MPTTVADPSLALLHPPTGLKRHSVTLFEGGRVSGEVVMKELISELWVSYKAGQVRSI